MAGGQPARARRLIRERSRSRGRGAGLLRLPPLAALLAAGCGPLVDRTPDLPAGEIARRIGLDLPAGTRIDHADYETGLDDAAHLVATMPAPAWPRLRARLRDRGGGAPVFSADHNFMLGSPQAGWRPDAAAGLATAQLEWRGGTQALNLGVAPAGAGRVRVFVFWHQM